MSREPHVLVIDDDQSIRELILLALQDEGYRVSTASDGVSALNLLQSTRPDVILLDMSMPVMSGVEFARVYRETDGPHAPIIALTAGRSPSMSATQISAAGYLAKPFDIDELVSLVQQYAHLGRPGASNQN